MLKVLDLFSGIGGFSLGLERTGGFMTVAFCEIEPFCQKVLRRHWPEVPIYDDVSTLTAARLAADGVEIDAICGGFPCQDISTAGQGEGLDGARSGLWREYARLIGELRPSYVIVENVAALLVRGLDRVLGELASLGYDAEWHCIPASAVGAPHLRDRVWIVAYPPNTIRRPVAGSLDCGERASGQETESGAVQEGVRNTINGGPAACGADVPNATGIGRGTGRSRRPLGINPGIRNAAGALAAAAGEPLVGAAAAWPECHPWDIEPNVGRVVDGLPAALVEDDLRALGNAVVPQIPELIGNAILAVDSTGIVT